MKDHDSKQRGEPERSSRSRAGRPEASVNMDELRELIALLRDNGLSEFELEREGFRVRLRRGFDFEGGATVPGGASSGASQPQPAPPTTPASPLAAASGTAAAAIPAKGSAAEDQ